MTFRELLRSLRVNSGDELPYSIELTRKLEDLRKISLNLVCILRLSVSRTTEMCID